MHHTTFATELGIPTYLAYGIEEACNAIIKDCPSHWTQETPFEIFGWAAAKNEKGQHRAVAGIGTAEAVKTGNISDTIPCWQIVELSADDPEVLALTDTKPANEELAALFTKWRLSLDIADPGVVPVQHAGSMTLLIFSVMVADRANVSIYDNGDEIHGPDIQLRIVLEKDGERSMLIIEPNPYTDRTSKSIAKHLN